MPRRTARGQIWVPRDNVTYYDILIDDVSVKSDAISSEFTHGVIGFESPCAIELIDADGTYAALYSGGETIELKLDLVDGTTSRWKGTLEKPKKRYGADAYTFKVEGSHYQADLLDIMATKEYNSGMTDGDVLKDLVSTYLTGYDVSGIDAFTTSGNYKWDEIPIYDCIVDICNNANAYCYVDSAKKIWLFSKGSKEITDEAVVWGDTLLSIPEGFGTDRTSIRNKIKIYGEDNAGLPVIHISNDQTSQDDKGIKETVVKDSSIKSTSQASDYGDAVKSQKSNDDESGETECLMMPGLFPGGKVWFTYPPQNVNGQYNLVKFTHRFPNEFTGLTIEDDENIPSIFKKRQLAERRSENLTNPFGMTESYNLVFDTLSDVDDALSSNINISDGYLYRTAGSTGTMISNNKSTSTTINYVHFKVNGDVLSGAAFYVSTDNGDTWKLVNLETETAVTAGTNLRIKVVLSNDSTRIRGVACLIKS